MTVGQAIVIEHKKKNVETIGKTVKRIANNQYVNTESAKAGHVLNPSIFLFPFALLSFSLFGFYDMKFLFILWWRWWIFNECEYNFLRVEEYRL